jgi:hypothetical protein
LTVVERRLVRILENIPEFRNASDELKKLILEVNVSRGSAMIVARSELSSGKNQVK